MKSLEEIIKPYKDKLESADYSKLKSADFILIQKWKDRIPTGWYGFDGINELWGEIIDDFLVELEKVAPNFEIHQIKLKFGGLRFYISLGERLDNDPRLANYINGQITLLEETLYSKDLIY
jgi:hypothetical protein